MSFENFNVLDFGADPNKPDNTQAFKDWSAAISKAGGGIGIVPPGTYNIDKTSDPNGSEDFRFEKCNGLKLIGYGAILSLKGNVLLTNDPVLLGSDKHMVCPFLIRQCQNVCIEGFEINGNADRLTMGEPVNTGGHCVSIVSSNHVSIRNMRIHNSWMDAISIRAKDYLTIEDMYHVCRNVVIENCELYSNGRASIGVHETRHIRISDCRIYANGMGIDIEPDLWIGSTFPPGTNPPDIADKDIDPPGSSRFTLIENCEIYNNYKPLSVNTKYSQVRVQGCFIDNQQNHPYAVILSAPHCSLLDSEINAGTGSIIPTGKDTLPGYNVFTMERCLVRTHTAMVNGKLTTGHGLFITAQEINLGGGVIGPQIVQGLIANNRFINESTHPWSPDVRLPNLSHGDSALQLTFRDNYVFIPKAAHHRSPSWMNAVGMHVQLAENNVYDTDLEGNGDFFQIIYDPSQVGKPPKFGVLVRNERFLSPGDGTSFRPGDNTPHNNMLPYSQGVQSVGTELPYGQAPRVFFVTAVPSVSVFTFQQGDLLFKSDASAGNTMGWVCTKGGKVGVDEVNPAVFAPMPNL